MKNVRECRLIILSKGIELAKSLFFNKSEEFSLLIRGQEANLSYNILPCDELGTSLIPEDVSEPDNRPVVMGPKFNRDCLFNAVSITLQFQQ